MKYFNSRIHILLALILLLSFVLRFYRVGSIPPSLYTDEINQGYNAYSLLVTGKDEHGSFMPISLRSFGDWKPPLPTYIMIPSILFLGLNETAVRIPSAILGVLSVLLVYLFIREVFVRQEGERKLALITSFFIAISPWHILQSRAAMLVIISLFCMQIGIWLFIRGSEKLNSLFLLSAVFFGLSFYAYYGMRIVIPLIILILFILYRGYIKQKISRSILFFCIIAVILLPLLIGFLKEPDVLLGRAKTVSIFYDQGIELRQWELISQDGIGANTLVTRFFHNNLYLYSRNILQRFFSHFNLRYLIKEGDTANPFQIPHMGILYIADVVFLLLGVYLCVKKKETRLILLWIFISFIPASLTFMTPSSNRSFTAVIPTIIVISYGIFFLLKKNLFHNIYVFLLLFAYIGNFWFFMNAYFLQLSKDYAQWWNYGWREVVDYIKNNEAQYENVIVSGTNGMPYVYFLFYKKYDPSSFPKKVVRSYQADRFGFEHVDGFDRYIFRNGAEWKQLKDELLPNSLVVVPAEQVVENNGYIHAVYYPNGEFAYKIFRTANK